jgi:hypothetical protein
MLVIFLFIAACDHQQPALVIFFFFIVMHKHQQQTLVMTFFIVTMHATASSFISLSDLSPITAPIFFRMNYGSSHLLNLVQLERFSETYFVPHPFNHQFIFHPCTYPTHLATELPHSPMLPTYPTHPSNLSFHFFKKKKNSFLPWPLPLPQQQKALPSSSLLPQVVGY